MIYQDWLAGFKDSVSVVKINEVLQNANIFKHLKIILIVNVFLYGVPYLLFGNVLCTVINIIATPFHLVKYFDLVGAAKELNTKNTKLFSTEELLSLALLMIIYQLVVQLIVWLLDFIFWPITIPILVFYHAFYCFNNLWQCQGIPLTTRSKRMEIMWPYYAGYASLSTILYLFSTHLLISAIYNIVFAINIVTVFAIVHHQSEHAYVPLNLSLFAYATRLAVGVVKRCLG